MVRVREPIVGHTRISFMLFRFTSFPSLTGSESDNPVYFPPCPTSAGNQVLFRVILLLQFLIPLVLSEYNTILEDIASSDVPQYASQSQAGVETDLLLLKVGVGDTAEHYQAQNKRGMSFRILLAPVVIIPVPRI